MEALQLSERLPNDEQRVLFSGRAQDHIRRSAERAAKFEANETERHRRLTFGTSALRERQRAAELLLEGDAEGANDALEASRSFVRLSMVGKSPEEQAATELALSSGYHGQLFQAKLSENPIAAQAYLADNRDAIDPGVFEPSMLRPLKSSINDAAQIS